MKTIRVLVVDDSAFMRKVITDILTSDPEIDVVGTAKNGLEALTKVKSLEPDVVTMDVEMPVMDGISTLKEIMNFKPIPIIMLSSLTDEGTDKAVQSMALGAVDFIAKPSGSISLDIGKIKNEMINKIKAASKIRVHKLKSIDTIPKANHIIRRKLVNPIIAMGTSTGGPRALQQVLTELPKDFPAPIVIVQHMPQGFTKSLAQRLDSLSAIRVKEAEHGEKIETATAYIAPGGYQFRVIKQGNHLYAHVNKEEPRNGHQPSVDVLFESLAEQSLYQVCAVIMTGMGADGANGVIELKKETRDTVIISESVETSIVYGMPQAAEKTKLVDHVVRLENISNIIVKKVKALG